MSTTSSKTKRRTKEQLRIDRAKAEREEANAAAAKERAARAASKPPPPEASAPAAPSRRERVRRYGQNYAKAQARVRAPARAVAQATPGTDTFGTVFKVLSMAGLIGLGILHPGAVKGVLDKATAVIKTVITGKA